MSQAPKITVVTPSYNQGQFLEETIQSVLGQCYPNLEYIIMDGGSTDDSVAIIKRYERHLAYWASGPDGGQSAAINAGFARSTGDILAWLNSDDTYLPGALAYVASHLDAGRAEVLLGNSVHLREGSPFCVGQDMVWVHQNWDLKVICYTSQPSAFWTRRAWEKTGLLNDSLSYAFDWEWFIRAEEEGIGFRPTSRYLSVYRFHEAHKTGTGGEQRQAELAAIYERYSGRSRRDLYLDCCRKADDVAKFDKLIIRLHVSRASKFLLRRRFPELFQGNNYDEVRQLIMMR